MIIKDIVDKYPQTLPVFGQFGMGCLGCSGALFESLEQGALAHGIDVEVMLNAINKLVQKQ
ncbi:MAG TPA: disulfide oxidoreductase [Syntrophomonas sp.]|jgi:hybrid cluster-associated redox disulfide protein|nr:disulfide oxidoreductase [Syntrophomonas sp.]